MKRVRVQADSSESSQLGTKRTIKPNRHLYLASSQERQARHPSGYVRQLFLLCVSVGLRCFAAQTILNGTCQPGLSAASALDSPVHLEAFSDKQAQAQTFSRRVSVGRGRALFTVAGA